VDDLAWGEDKYIEELAALTEELADLFFISENTASFVDRERYDLGLLSPPVWWSLVLQLDEIALLDQIVDLCHELDDLLGLDGLPVEVLEYPFAFLDKCLQGLLPPEPSGRRVSSRKLVKIARIMVSLLQLWPPEAQAAVRAWANIHRQVLFSLAREKQEKADLAERLFSPDLPPALTGLSMVLALTLVRWPERAEEMPIPQIIAPEMYDQVLQEWEDLPDTPAVTEEGEGEAESLFAQAQLAHLLAQMGAKDPLYGSEAIDEETKSQTYSRMSRAALWLHNHCRHCPEREGITCKVAVGGPVLPMPLLDVGAEIANTGRIVGCVKM